jgi:dolichol-phosphate mannosyltransferase
VVDALNSLQEANSSLFGLVAWIGYQQDYVEYERRERQIGKSKWRFRARMRLAKDWVIAFSGIPLKVMTVMGFAVAALGMLYALWVMGVAIFGEPIQGWASIMVVVLIIGGLQMAMLGIMGEYLWRTLEETRQRKLYFIEKSTEHAPAISLPRTLELR